MTGAGTMGAARGGKQHRFQGPKHWEGPPRGPKSWISHGAQHPWQRPWQAQATLTPPSVCVSIILGSVSTHRVHVHRKCPAPFSSPVCKEKHSLKLASTIGFGKVNPVKVRGTPCSPQQHWDGRNVNIQSLFDDRSTPTHSNWEGLSTPSLPRSPCKRCIVTLTTVGSALGLDSLNVRLTALWWTSNHWP